MKSSEGKAKAKESRGRVATDEQSPDISSPGFSFTDAASRDDLYALPRRHSKQRSASRPRTGGGKSDRSEMDRKWGSPKRSKPSHNDLSSWEQYRSRTEQQVLHEARLEQFSIGMALGSPSHPPWTQPPRNDTPDSGFSVPTSTQSGSFSSAPYEPFVEDHRQRGKWKMFGGIFSRKGSSHPTTPASPFYSVVTDLRNQPPVLAPQPASKPSVGHEARSHQDWSPDFPSPLGSAGPRSADNQRPTKSKPLMPRAYTSPDGPALAPSPVVPAKDLPPPGPKRSASTAPLLQVDIPDVAMERYSIMFGSVLGKPRSSIMVRRQQQLERLKVVDDFPSEETEEGQELLLPLRRATLPSPAKSPSYSLFPHTHQPERKPSPLSSTTRPPPTPLQRSNTAPAVSPGRTNFEMIKPMSDHSKVIFTIDSPSPSTDSPETPAGAPWASDISHTSTSTTALDHGEVSPRDPEDIIIKLEAPTSVGTLKDSTSMPHLRRDISPPRPYHDSKARSSPKAFDLRSKYNTTPLVSPLSPRHFSLNKPLPSPQAAIEQEAREARQNSRKQSLPVAQVRTVEIRGSRKGSLPTRPSPSLELRARKGSLQAAQPPALSVHSPLKQCEQPRPSLLPQPTTKIASKPTHHSAPRNQLPENPKPSTTQPAQPAQPTQTAQPKPTHQNPLKSSPASAAEISIARQISISRRQQMMVPIIPKTVRQPQQATLVVPGEGDDEDGVARSAGRGRGRGMAQGQGYGYGHVARKSQHGLVESV